MPSCYLTRAHTEAGGSWSRGEGEKNIGEQRRDGPESKVMDARVPLTISTAPNSTSQHPEPENSWTGMKEHMKR